jgi:hypothetical protein
MILKKKIYNEYIIPQQLADDILNCLKSDKCRELNITTLKPLIKKIIINNKLNIENPILKYLSQKDDIFIKVINEHLDGNKLFELLNFIDSFCMSLLMFKYK